MPVALRERVNRGKRRADDMEGDEIMINGPQSSNQRKVTIVVCENNEQQLFEINVNLLKAHSVDFRRKLENYDDDQETKPLIVGNVSVETFKYFTEWIAADRTAAEGVVVEGMQDNPTNDLLDEDGNRKTFVKPTKDSTQEELERFMTDYIMAGKPANAGAADEGMNDDPANNSAGDGNRNNSDQPKAETINEESFTANQKDTNAVFRRLVDLFVFAARYDCPHIRLATIIQFQRCVDTWDAIPGPSTVKHALKSLELNAPLCRWIILCYGFYINYHENTSLREASLPADFLSEVLSVTYQRLRSLTQRKKEWFSAGCSFAKIEGPGIDVDWCNFHEHENDAEREDCERRRQGDPDVQEKLQLQYLRELDLSKIHSTLNNVAAGVKARKTGSQSQN